MSVYLIALHGHDEVGKSTTAHALSDALNARGLRTAVLSLGAQIRRDVATLGYDAWQKPTPPHLRELLRAHGEGARAAFGQDYWIDRLMQDQHAGEAHGMDVDVVIVDDCRQMHEYTYFTQQPGTAFVSLVRQDAEPDRGPLWLQFAAGLIPPLRRFLPQHPPVVEAVWEVRDEIVLWGKPPLWNEWIQHIRPGDMPHEVAEAILDRLHSQIPRVPREPRRGQTAA